MSLPSSSPGLFSLVVRRARSVTVYDVDSTVPFAMAASDVGSVAVVDSVFEVGHLFHSRNLSSRLLTLVVIVLLHSLSPGPGSTSTT